MFSYLLQSSKKVILECLEISSKQNGSLVRSWNMYSEVGIRSSVFWSNQSFIVIERSKDQFDLENQSYRNLYKIDKSNFIFWHKKGEKLSKTYENTFFSRSNQTFFGDRKINSILNWLNRSWKRSKRSNNQILNPACTVL